MPWWGPSSDLPNGAAGGDRAPWPREEPWVGENRALWASAGEGEHGLPGSAAGCGWAGCP